MMNRLDDVFGSSFSSNVPEQRVEKKCIDSTQEGVNDKKSKQKEYPTELFKLLKADNSRMLWDWSDLQSSGSGLTMFSAYPGPGCSE